MLSLKSPSQAAQSCTRALAHSQTLSSEYVACRNINNSRQKGYFVYAVLVPEPLLQSRLGKQASFPRFMPRLSLGDSRQVFC